jgi:hypothetical protein
LLVFQTVLCNSYGHPLLPENDNVRPGTSKRTPNGPYPASPLRAAMIPPTPKTFLVETFVQAIFYGVYLITLLHSLRWLLFEDERWKIRSAFNLPTLIVTLFLLMTSTTDLFIAFRISSALLSGETVVSTKLEILDVRMST